MALPSSGYLGQWFSTKQLFLKFSRIFRRPASGKRGRILIKVQVISLLSDITDRLARAFFGCVLSGNSSENEYVQKRITAHAVGTVNTSCFNLLKNAKEALKAQKADEPKLFIKLSSSETHCFVDISDNGAVISDSDFERMGSVFKSGKASGLGIGLSIVRSIVQNHNGSLVLERGKNGGLVCRIRLPILNTE